MRARALSVVAILGIGALGALPGQATGAVAQKGCDPIDPTACMLPFPNDWYTVRDPATATGRRVGFQAAAMPHNMLGIPIDPAGWNHSDGFSPGSMLLTHVPGVDLAKSGAAPITDIGSSLRRDAPIVIVDTVTGQRWPYWAELDANATSGSRQALIVRPARNFLEGHRYVVGLRGLKGVRGTAIPAGAAFRKILGPPLKKRDPLYQRQRQEQGVLKELARNGVSTKGLYLAWDFTVASQRNLSERMLHIRDDAFKGLGSRSPGYVVTKVTDNAAGAPIAREVKGVVLVPSYLNGYGGLPGTTFNYGRDGLPARLPGNTQLATFQCEIPRAAFAKPGHASLYGHGLLGDESEVAAAPIQAMAAEHDFVFCATKWAGMSSDDLPNVGLTLTDLSRFPTIADRLQQGVLNALWLGRAMIHDSGLTSNAAFRTKDGKPLIDTKGGLVYYGNSQGGIMGGMLTAVATDVHRSVLGVPAVNYSTLLNRSSDFSRYATVLNTAYPDKLDQQLALALIQMLWDRGEADGYALHMTDRPLPGTPAHQVLMHIAFGDHQVSTNAAEVEARTIGARIHVPAVAPGRNPDVVPYWGIPAIGSGPYPGSAMVVWDSGAPYQPLSNTPPTTGHDPHGDPRKSPVARQQIAIFLTTGQIVDVCAAAPCTAPQGS